MGRVASRICSKHYVAFLCGSCQDFSQCILLALMWCLHTVVLKKLRLLNKSDFPMIANLSITIHFFFRHMFTLLWINKILLLRYGNWSAVHIPLILVVCLPSNIDQFLWNTIPGRVIPKTFKMVLDTSLLNTQQYKVRIKGKVKQSRERSSALPYASV